MTSKKTLSLSLSLPPTTHMAHTEKSNETTPPSSHLDSSSQREDQDLTASLLSQTLATIPPSVGPPTDLLPSRLSPFQPPSGELPKRRPLPIPPSILQHSQSSSESHRIPSPIPSTPPPPYSIFLPAGDPVPTTRDLSRLAPPASHTTLAPEAPVIMPPLPNEQVAQGRAPYDSFLCHSPPANTWIAVETSQLEYVLLVRLPGFRRDGMLVCLLSISHLFTHPSA